MLHEGRWLWLGCSLLIIACGPERSGTPRGEPNSDGGVDLSAPTDGAAPDLAGSTDAAVDGSGNDAAGEQDLTTLSDGGKGADSGPEPDLGFPAPDLGLPEPICGEGLGWAPGQAIFREVTADRGLAELQVEGVRLNIVDLEGDGWPDLLVRKADGAETYGEGGTRTRWLLRNTGERFEDVTQASGAFARRREPDPQQGRPVSIVAAADVDNDGDTDLFLGAPIHVRRDAVNETGEILLNRGDGTFELGPADSGVRMAGKVAIPAGAAFVDVDRDGLIDLWLPQNIETNGDEPLQDRLFRGDGQGGFSDITASSGLTTESWLALEDLNAGRCHTYAWSGAACDLNGDGVTELLSASYGRAPNHLWQGALGPDGIRFENRSVASGYAFDQRLDWTDNESARCWCQLHPEDEECEGVPRPQYIRCRQDSDAFRWNHQFDREPFRLGGNSGTTVCADVNNDGWLDLLTTEIVHWDVGSSSDPAELLVNAQEPQVRFERPGNDKTGLTRTRPLASWNDGDMTAAVFDFDNDGWPDIYIGSSDYPGDRGLLWHQLPENPGHFVAVAITDFFEHNRSHGVVAADFDRDGDLDLVVGHSRARCSAGEPNDCYPTQQVRMFLNELGQRNSWLQLRLEGGAGTNRSAIGARVTVTADGITQTQEVEGGHGHFGTQRDLLLHFGLGGACRAEVTIRWPDRALTTETHRLPAGHRFQLVQGQPPRVVE